MDEAAVAFFVVSKYEREPVGSPGGLFRYPPLKIIREIAGPGRTLRADL